MSVIVITTPGAENKQDANLILRNNLVLNVVLRTGMRGSDQSGIGGNHGRDGSASEPAASPLQESP